MPVCLQLWRFTSQGDSTWWQRIVGLVQHHVPHPDSWHNLISSYSSTRNSTTPSSLSTNSVDSIQEVQQLHELLHGCPSRVRSSPSVAGKNAPCGGGLTAGQGAPKSAASRLSGFVVKPLQLDGCAASSSGSSAAVQARSAVAAAAAATSCVEAYAPDHVGSQEAASTASTAAAAASWPELWSAEDVAWLSQLVQAEELLETAVHMLLGVGADSSGELYDKLRAMTRGQGLALEVRE
jgi:hypothetical protein